MEIKKCLMKEGAVKSFWLESCCKEKVFIVIIHPIPAWHLESSNGIKRCKSHKNSIQSLGYVPNTVASGMETPWNASLLAHATTTVQLAGSPSSVVRSEPKMQPDRG